MKKHQILTDTDINTKLKELADWEVREGKLCADFVFADFKEALTFINQVAVVAEDMNHHPEIINIYNKVSLALSTHDVGDKITNTDTELARRVSVIASK